MTYSIEALSESNSNQWEDFNHQSREGTLFHGIVWKTFLEDEFALKTRYYLIRDDQKVIGICPSIEHSVGYFRGLNCLPHSEFNNLILDDSFDSSRINDLLSLLSEKYAFLHFTTYNPDLLERIGFESYQVEETGNMILDLKEMPPDTIWNSVLSKDERYKIRTFDRDGFQVREIHELDDIEQFYRYYQDNMVFIRGDILPISFFRRLLASFSPDTVRVAVITKGEVFAGGGLTVLYPPKKMAYFEYFSLNRALPNRYTPIFALAWEGITWAWDHGFEKISFGRQKLDPDNPRFRNKTKFGAAHVPLYSRLVLLSKTASLLYRLRKSTRGFGKRMEPSPHPSPSARTPEAPAMTRRGSS